MVVVRGKFDAEKLCKKVWCKAGSKVVKEIIIVDVWPIPPKPPKPCDPCNPKPEKCCVCDHCKPKPEKCCVCDHCKPKPKQEQKPKPEEKPKAATPKTEYKFVPYPYLVPNPGMCQSWPWQCPPHQQCQCCQKPPSPPPAPPQRPPCTCSSHGSCGCGQTLPVWPPQPPVWPPPWAGCNVVADENSCSVM